MRKLPVIALTLALTGCAVIRANETRETEQLLTVAGFQAEPAATAGELARLRTLEARSVVKEMQNGEARYVYADPDGCGCSYDGGERQYRNYRRLRVESDIAAERAGAAEWAAWDNWPWP
jgi:hypothetical protein